MTKDFQFDAATHRYTIAGATVPSVTQIIGAVIPRNYSCDGWYLDRGRAIHAAIHLLAKGKLDWSSVDPRILPRLQAFQKFQTQTGYVVQESELKLLSARYQFAGTIDALMVVTRSDIGERRVLVDFKSSLEPQVIPQLGGYSLLLRENGRGLSAALGLELREDSNCRCKWLTGSELRLAEQTFLGLLTSRNFMQKYGLTNN